MGPELGAPLAEGLRYLPICATSTRDRERKLQGFRPMSGLALALQKISIRCSYLTRTRLSSSTLPRWKGGREAPCLPTGTSWLQSLQVIVPMDIRAADVYLNLMPLFHVMGLELAMSCCVCRRPKRHSEQIRPCRNSGLDRTGRRDDDPHSAAHALGDPGSGRDTSAGSLKTLRVVAGLFDHPDTIRRCKQMTDARFWVGFRSN